MVKWLLDDEGNNNYVHVAAQLLLFACLSENEDESKTPLIVAVIHSLQHYVPQHDSLLFFAKGDTLDDNGIVVKEATEIAKTAFVLPCVENHGDQGPLTNDAATYLYSLQGTNGMIFGPKMYMSIDSISILYQ
jgi:hypothetical protein